MLSQVTMEIGARCLYQEVWRFGTQFLPDLSASIRLCSYQGEPETCPFPVGWGCTDSSTWRSLPSASALCQWPPRRWAFPEALASRGLSGVAVVTSFAGGRDPRVAVWAGSPHWGPLWGGEHRPEKKMVLPSAWLLRTVAAVVGCRLGLRSFGGLLSRPLPSSASGGGILSFCAFYQEEIGARSSTVLSGPPHPGECAGSAGFSTRFCSQDPMAAAALMNWAQVSGESLSLPDSSVGGGVFSGFPNLAFVAHFS